MDCFIADLLSLTQVEARERVCLTEKVDLKNVVSENIRALNPIIEETDLELVIELSESPSGVMGEYDQLHQAFMNLIENTIK